MFFLPILSISIAFHALGVTSKLSYQCTRMSVPVTVSVDATQLKIRAPTQQRQLTGFIQQFVSATSNVSTEVVGGKTRLNGTYDIWSQLCIPESFPEGGTVELAVHGINFDHFYWEFGGNGSKYNYIEAAINVGHAIFTFDRLGTGLSGKPDGIKEVQTSTEIAITAQLVARLWKGVQGHIFGRVVGIGHSYGSFLLVGLAAVYGNLVNDTILTGFSTSLAGFPTATASLGLILASEQDATRFGSLDSSYLVTASIVNVQQVFFHYPEFSISSLELAERLKGVTTIGELLTITEVLFKPAVNYTGSVLVVSGDKDLIVCGGNCYQSFEGSADLLEPTRMLFPAASNFSTYIPAGVGHAINAHFGAPAVYRFIEEWIGR